MHLDIIALVFGVIFIAELPDKSLFASLVLGTRFPTWYVWLGASAAFLVHVIIAVTAGHLLTLLPGKSHEIIVALLFFLGAGLILLGKHDLGGPTEVIKKPKREDYSFWRVFSTSFGVVFIGEWGDITQIVTANYTAKYHAPLSVGIGATLALWTVCALAVILGSKALGIIPPRILQRITGFILLVSGIVSLVSALR